MQYMYVQINVICECWSYLYPGGLSQFLNPQFLLHQAPKPPCPRLTCLTEIQQCRLLRLIMLYGIHIAYCWRSLNHPQQVSHAQIHAPFQISLPLNYTSITHSWVYFLFPFFFYIHLLKSAKMRFHIIVIRLVWYLHNFINCGKTDNQHPSY